MAMVDVAGQPPVFKRLPAAVAVRPGAKAHHLFDGYPVCAGRRPVGMEAAYGRVLVAIAKVAKDLAARVWIMPAGVPALPILFADLWLAAMGTAVGLGAIPAPALQPALAAAVAIEVAFRLVVAALSTPLHLHIPRARLPP